MKPKQPPGPPMTLGNMRELERGLTRMANDEHVALLKQGRGRLERVA